MKRTVSIRVALTGFLWIFLGSSALARCPCFTPTGIKRPTPTADFKIDCSSLPLGITCNEFQNAVVQAAQTWNAVGTNFQFDLTPNPTSMNVVRFGPLASVVALTENDIDPATGQIVQTILTFNIALDWATTGSRFGPAFDLQGVATHEFGHWLHLDDIGIGGLRCRSVTMSSDIKFLQSGSYLRTLTRSDEKGIRFIYGPNPPRLLSDLTVPAVDVDNGGNVMFDIENQGCGPAAPTTHNVQAISVNDSDVVVNPVSDPFPLPPRTASFPCPGDFCPRRSFSLAVSSFDKECFYRVTADASNTIPEVRERNNTEESPVTQCIAGLERDIIIPSSLADVEGNINNVLPFDLIDPRLGASLPPVRYQQVYAASEFSPILGPIVITRITFRPDAGFGSAFSSVISNIEINLSTTSVTPDGLSAVFADNVGSDDTVVHSGALMLSSTFTGPAEGPKDFDIVISLQTPFVYDPSRGNLLMDVRNFSGETTTSFDTHIEFSDGTSRVGTAGLTDVNSPTAEFADSAGLITKFVFRLPASGITVVSADTPQNIPDPGQITSVLTFPTDGTILDMTLFFQFTHECERDLIMDLTAPDGHTVGVMNRGLERCSGVPTTFTSNNTILGQAQFFGGRQAAGNWTLIVNDDSPGLTGTLDTWRLTIQVQP